jgi:Na+-driven multidrug efflux pump
MITALIGLCCTLLFVLYGSEVFSIIVPEKAAYEAGGSFLRIDGFSMIPMMFEITTQGLFYGMGKTVPPAAVSITCNTLRIPFAIILVTTSLGINGVWWAISITSMMKGVILFSWFLFTNKKAKM